MKDDRDSNRITDCENDLQESDVDRETLSDLCEMGKFDRRRFMQLLAGAGVSAVGIRRALADWTQMPCNACHSQAPASPYFIPDPNTEQLIQRAKNLGIQIIYDRGTPCTHSHFNDKAGNAGLCCFRCQMGPCTLGEASALYNPDNPLLSERGRCGAGRDVIVTRDLVRRIAGGASAHIEHAREAAKTLLLVASGTSPYQITDPVKLDALFVGLKCPGSKTTTYKKPNPVYTVEMKAEEVAKKCLDDLGDSRDMPAWLEYKANAERKQTWEQLGILPIGGSAAVCEAQHRTTMGVDADMVSLAKCGLKLGLVDGYCGLHMATGIQDVLFGTPTLSYAKSNLAVIEQDKINLVLHGHEPLLSEKILDAADVYNASSPTIPINVVGMCCTGNELLMRRGVNLAGAMVQQELAIVTGAVDAMVVDVQCVIPAVQQAAEQFHTKIITTHPHAHITGADRIEFEPENADVIAQQIIQAAVANYANRDPIKVYIPTDPPKDIVAGFSVEQIVSALSAVDQNDPIGLLISLITADPSTAQAYIRGVVAIVGCVTPLDTFGYRHVALTRRLLAENILVLGTGCWAQVAGQYGLLSADASYPGVGDGLKAVLQTVAGANGLTALPACWHMGSCVDNSRIEDVLNAVAGHASLGVKISQLPVAASAPEFITEKSVSIGTWAVDLGVFTHIGGQPYISGSDNLVSLLTNDIAGLVGGKFYVENDPETAADTMINLINARRTALGLAV